MKRIVCLDDYEDVASTILPKSAFDYYAGGADDEVTLCENRDGFKRLRIMPRMLRDVSSIDMRTTLLGIPLSFPVCISPTAIHAMAHPEGEIAVAKGAAASGIIYSLSLASSVSIEKVASVSASSPKLFQLNFFEDRDLTLKLLRRAEDADFKGILLTVDMPVVGTRRRSQRNQFKLPPHLKFANFNKTELLNVSTKESGPHESYSPPPLDPSQSWQTLKWLTENTRLPIIVKGILSADDAREALKYNISGILVSNHGARQLDTVPATIDCLAEIVKEVNGRCEVYLDGGIRTGTDVLKAICLGATAVFVGRPAVFALACNGQVGVEEMLSMLKNEFKKAMELTGCRSIKDLDKNLIRKTTEISKL